MGSLPVTLMTSTIEEHPPLNLFRGHGDPSFFGKRNHDSKFVQIHKQINMVCFRHGRDFLSFVGRYIMS